MRFELLGTVGLRVDTDQIVIPAGRDRIVLATLLLHANNTVSTSVLVEAVWGSQPPTNARNQLQGCVSRLRRRLAAIGGADRVVITDPSGYRARVDPQDLDLCEFRRLREEGQAAAATGDAGGAIERYRSALALWRGQALAGVDSALLRQAATTLEEERLRATEECLDVELAQGKAGELIPELTELVQQHPYQEKLHAALMLALYRAGRQADALAAYRQVRQVLRDELGAEPGDQLQRLHRAILNRDPELDLPDPAASPAASAGAGTTPRELPAEVPAFTGREAALRTLDGLLEDPAPPVVISAIAGTAGVGKTALAVHWAHRVADQFPDGQLYLNLRGYASGPPLRPIDALGALLRSLGAPPDQIPTDEAEAAGRYRSQLAGRRMLVVLDNVGSVDQVRPLLPGSAGCLVLITSRDRLAGLVARDGARRVTLDVLSPDEAYALLERLLGSRRVADEPDAVATLAQTCAYLPLALRIAAASLTDHQSIAEYVAELTDGDRLTMLQAEGDQETAVRATFDLSYQRLPADAQHLFRLLGLVPGPDISPAAAAALAGHTVADVQPLLTKLTSAHLLTEHAPGRYTFHDLLRLYARQISQAQDGPDRRGEAMARWQDYYLANAGSAVRCLYPQMARLPLKAEGIKVPPRADFQQPSGSLAWLDEERACLLAAIRHAAVEGPSALVWLLTDQLRGYFLRRRLVVEWRIAADAALDAADKDGGDAARAAAQLSLADLCRITGEYERAIEHGTAASTLAQQAGWTEAQAAALGGLGGVLWWLGSLSQAAKHFMRALDLNRKAGRRLGQAGNSLYLGILEQERGRLQSALNGAMTALRLYRECESVVGEADALNSLGTLLCRLGRFTEARVRLSNAMNLYQSVGDAGGEAGTLDSLAEVHHATGHVEEALDCATSAQRIFAETHDLRGEASAHNALGRVQVSLHRYDDAVVHHRHAVELAQGTGTLHVEVEGLIGLAMANLRQGEVPTAQDNVQAALGIARGAGYRLFEGEALTTLAEVRAREGHLEQARTSALLALDVHRDTSHRPGEARTLAFLGRLAQSSGRIEEATHRWRMAREMFAEMGAQPPEDLPEVSGGGPG